MAESKKAFVLMPFKEPYNSYYNAIYKPALEAASYTVTRADDLFSSRPIMLDIQQSILEANLILCDMSERNPNVFYELGLAHAIGKPAILVARKEDDIPFDLRHIRVVLFDYSFPGWEEKLRQNITATARKVNETTNLWPPPLIDTEDRETRHLREVQELKFREVELDKARWELEIAKSELNDRLKITRHAMDAIGQAFSASQYPMDPREVEIIKEIIGELRGSVGQNYSTAKLEKSMDMLDSTFLNPTENENSEE